MNYNPLSKITVASALAFGGLAMADINIPMGHLADQQPEGKNYSAYFNTGYSSKYVCRNIAFEGSATQNAVPLEVQGSYKFNDKYSLIGGVKYLWLLENRFDHDDTGVCDEGSALLGINRKWTDRLQTALSYQFVHGGIPGQMDIKNSFYQKHDFPAFNHDHPEEHSFVFDLHYDFSKNSTGGFFIDSRTQYAVRWLTGWWFINTLGYKYDVNPSVSVILSGSWSATAGYFQAQSLNDNGSQGFSINLSVPIKVGKSKRVTLAPFISTRWLDDGALTANHQYGGRIFSPFDVVAGMGISFSF